MEDHLDEGRRGDEGPHLAWQACAPVHECVCVFHGSIAIFYMYKILLLIIYWVISSFEHLL